jgi:hypothetical protein
MAIARILAIRAQPHAPPETKASQASYETLMKTSVSRVRTFKLNDYKTPVVFRDGRYIRAYHGMELKIKDCIGPSARFIILIQCGAVTKEVGGSRWAYIRGAEDVPIMDSFPIQYEMNHAGPAVENISGGQAGVSGRSFNPSPPNQ